MAKTRRWRDLDRKLWILPLLALATAVAVLVPTEIILRARYPNQEIDRCIVDSAGGAYAKPNCISYVKVAEGPWIENRYNECGYRSPLSCGPARPGSYRIAVIGSSMGAGFFVPEPKSLSGRLPAQLEKACNRVVESQNLALPDFPIAQLSLMAAKALALNPDVLIVTVSSYDLEKPSDQGLQQAKPFIRMMTDAVEDPLKASTTVYMAKNLYLSNEKSYSNFIAAQRQSDEELAKQTHGGILLLAEQIDQIAKLAYPRRVPIVLTFMPRREEFTRERVWPGHRDPAAAALGWIAEERGIGYVDGLSSVPKEVATSSLYYVANHHMNGTGNYYIANAVVKKLISAAPPFTRCRAD